MNRYIVILLLLNIIYVLISTKSISALLCSISAIFIFGNNYLDPISIFGISIKNVVFIIFILVNYRAISNLFTKEVICNSNIMWLMIGTAYVYINALILTKYNRYETLAYIPNCLMYYLISYITFSAPQTRKYLPVYTTIVLACAMTTVFYVRMMIPLDIPIISTMKTVEPVSHRTSGSHALYAIPLVLLLMRKKKTWGKSIYIGLLVYLAISIVMGGARTALIALIPVIFIYNKNVRNTVIMLIMIGIIATIASKYMDNTFSSERINTMYTAVATRNIEQERNIEFRYDHLIMGMEIFKENLIYGIGISNWNYYLQVNFSTREYGESAHNSYIKHAAEAGLIGLVLLIVLIYKTYTNSKGMKRIGEEYKAVAVSIIGLLIISISSDTLISTISYFMLGIVHAGISKKKVARVVNTGNCVL